MGSPGYRSTCSNMARLGKGKKLTRSCPRVSEFARQAEPWRSERVIDADHCTLGVADEKRAHQVAEVSVMSVYLGALRQVVVDTNGDLRQVAARAFCGIQDRRLIHADTRCRGKNRPIAAQ